MPPKRRAVALVVASVVPYPAVGGGHKRTLRLLEAMRRAGADPVLLAASPPEPGASEELLARGIRLEPVYPQPPRLADRARQHGRRLPSPYLSAVARRLEELAAGERPAFVQLEHTQNAYYFDSVPGLPVALSLHNVDSELVATLARAERPGSLRWARLWNRWHAMRTVERRAARRADAVLCVSEHDAQHFAPVAGSVLTVPNGVDDALFEIDPRLPESETVLFFGQLDYPPNDLGILRFLREGWPFVAQHRREALLRIVGDGASARLASGAAVAERVELAGRVESIEAELAASSAVLVPIWEGGGTRLKVLEAMGAARPVAGTPLGVGGIGFEHERHGLVGESAAAVAEAVVSLLADRARARELAGEGRRLAEGFRWSAVTEPAQDLYRRWVERS